MLRRIGHVFVFLALVLLGIGVYDIPAYGFGPLRNATILSVVPLLIAYALGAFRRG